MASAHRYEKTHGGTTEMEMLSLEKELSENAYPGQRNRDRCDQQDGKKAVTAYFIMGRSVKQP